MRVVLALLLATLFTAACGNADPPDNVVYTLYTNAPSDPFFRTRIATFDYFVGKDWTEVDQARNQKLCNETATMFQARWEREVVKNSTDAGLKAVKHWCEKGRYRE